MIHDVKDFINLPRQSVSSHVSTQKPTCTRTRTNIYMYQRTPTCAWHVQTYTCTDTSTYTCTCTNIYMHQPIPTSTRTIIHIYTYQHHTHQSRHSHTIKFCPYMELKCCHDIHTRMLSQHSKLTCIHGNTISKLILQHHYNINTSTFR